MKLTVNGQQYDLRFNTYDQLYRGKIKPLKGEEVPTTVAYLAWFDGKNVNTAMATAHCSPKDVYNEGKGRKVALSRLLDHIWPSYDGIQIATKPELRALDAENKTKREAFWKEYLTAPVAA